MSNMSYCRFRNTDKDFADCARALDGLDFGTEEPLLKDEFDAAVSLLYRVVELAGAVANYTGEELDDISEEDVRSMLTEINNLAKEQVDCNGSI